ncbi:MAG: hypothetical protein ACTJGD_08030 [Mesonia hippocampi]|uniref:hypothetical protein n=1 Tax=Mesonia hippocampi TaxID=1628250 RepID=UPI003F9B1883
MSSTQDKYHSLLQSTDVISLKDTDFLKELTEKYPYFQSAQALLLKALKNNNSFAYNAALKRTAAQTTDRNVLFDYITSKAFNQHQVAKNNQELTQQVQDNNKDLSIDVAEAEKILDPNLFEPTQKETHQEETTLGLGKPLNFTKEETYSFNEWLKLTQAKKIPAEPQKTKAAEKKSAEKNKKLQLIDNFIAKNPKIVPQKDKQPTRELSFKTKPENRLMTETLAKVYLEQKNYQKAIQAYKILILKNPEKSGFFADQIRAIEKIQENKNQ